MNLVPAPTSFPFLLSYFYLLLSNIPLLLSNIPLLLSNIPLLLSNIPLLLSNIPLLLSNIPLLLSNIPLILLYFPLLLSNILSSSPRLSLLSSKYYVPLLLPLSSFRFFSATVVSLLGAKNFCKDCRYTWDQYNMHLHFM